MTSEAVPRVRRATIDDVPALQALIARSARGLSDGFYTPAQVESAVRHLFGVDTQLVHDGTYFVIEADGALVAGGGWSRRRTLYGGDQSKQGEDAALDPASRRLSLALLAACMLASASDAARHRPRPPLRRA